MKKLSKKTISELIKLKELVMKVPERLDMEDWYYPSSKSPCGTAACFAGHIVLSKINAKNFTQAVQRYERKLDRDGEGPGIHHTAMTMIGVTGDQSHKLFMPSGWPEDLWESYETARCNANYKLAAEIACVRIDRFIASNGKE